MNFHQALEQYLLTRCHLPVESRTGTQYVYTPIDVMHEEGWSNDSGTSWPASVYIMYRRDHFRNGKKTGSKRDSVFVNDNPIEFMKDLFNMVEDSSD